METQKITDICVALKNDAHLGMGMITRWHFIAIKIFTWGSSWGQGHEGAVTPTITLLTRSLDASHCLYNVDAPGVVIQFL